MVLPVLVMIGIGYFCNRKQIFDMNGLKEFESITGRYYAPVMLSTLSRPLILFG